MRPGDHRQHKRGLGNPETRTTCAHVDTFPIAYATARCVECRVALSVSTIPPYLRTVIDEARSTSWNEVEAALRGRDEPRRIPIWLRAIVGLSGLFRRS